jgi:hypothetical protein
VLDIGGAEIATDLSVAWTIDGPAQAGNTYAINGTSNALTVLKPGLGTVQVNGTEGELDIQGGQHVTVGSGRFKGFPAGGDLIGGQVVLTNPAGNGLMRTIDLTVDDSLDPVGRTIALAPQSIVSSVITGLNTAGIEFNPYNLTALTIKGGQGGNAFLVQTMAGGPPTTINDGNGGDTVDVLGTAAGSAATVNAGTGGDTVNVGSDPVNLTQSKLDPIQGPVTVKGAGANTTLNVHDDGSTSSQYYSVYADSFRRFDVTTGAPNMAAIGYTGIGHLAFYQGSAQAVMNFGAIRNILVVWSSAFGTTTDIYGGPGANYDEVRPYDADPGTPADNRGIRGDVHFHGNNRYDTLTYYDYLHPAGQQTYTLSATATGGQIVDSGFATVTYDSKVVGAGILTSRQGSNTVNVLSTTASAYYGTQIEANTGDHVIVGMPVAGGRTLAGINGFLSIFSVDGNPNVVPAGVLIDDSGDTAAHPGVVINGDAAHPGPDVVGLAPAIISWLSLAPTTPVTILGGSGGNHFQVNGTAAGTPLTISAGAGGDTVDVGSTANTLDTIQGALTVQGQGNTTLNFNDKGGTPGTAPNRVYNYYLAQDTFSRTGTATVSFTGMATVNLNAANAGSSGYNVLGVFSTAPGTTYNVNAGTGLNEFLVFNISYTINDIQGPLNLHGTSGTLPDDDLVEIFDVDKTTAHTIAVNAGPTPQSGVVQRFADQAMLHPDAATITYDGLNAYATLYTGESAGHTINVQSNASDLFTIIGAGATDTVNVGNSSHTLAAIQGDLRIDGSTPKVNVDDSGDTASHTTTTTPIDLAGDGANGYRITGLLPQSAPNNGRLWLLLDPAAPVALKTGTGDDVFRVHDFNSAPAISIDAGGGIHNQLDYSAYTGTVMVVLPLGMATGFASVSGIQDVTGGIGNNLLVGDSNPNILIGGTGRNVLIGGAGGDTLDAHLSTGDNILIGGRTDYDSNLAALNAIFAEWTRTNLPPQNSFQIRYNDLLSGMGSTNPLNKLPDGTFVLLTPATNKTSSNGTVHADTSIDTLIASNGIDPTTGKRVHNWFFDDSDDTIVNFPVKPYDHENKVT